MSWRWSSARAGPRRASSGRRRASARGRPRAARRASSNLASGVTGTKRWSHVAARRSRGGACSWLRGLHVYARASSPTSPSSVAEKNIVWRSRGRARDDAVDLRLEAHVEHAVGLVEHEDLDRVELDEPRSIRSSSRPGVATTMCAPAPASPGARCPRRRRRRRPERPRASASGASSSATWAASSRVGTRTSAQGRASAAFRRSTIGIAKASVLPEPVGDLTSTSRPSSASGMTSVWMAKGDSTPRRESASTTASATPS